MQTKKRLLVVDDLEINRCILENILKDKYTIIQAKNGREALDHLLENEEEISLILLDLQMPVMDGYDFLKIVKEHPKFSPIPVVVTTQCEEEQEEIRALSLGASDFLMKPYNPEIIRYRIGGLIKLCETYALINTIEHDQVTGLYTKEYFYGKVNEILTKYPDKKFDMINGDIVGYKILSDIFGENITNDILKQAGNTQKKLNSVNGITCRYGTDTFMTFTEHRDDYKMDEFIQLNKYLEESMPFANISMKFGIYNNVNKNIAVSTMCDRAMLAVKEVKPMYDKCVAYYDEGIRKKIIEERKMIEGMITAIKERQFKVFFQPKYNIKTNKISGAEALVRWMHPQKGLLLPGAFVPIFEEHGYIDQMDLFVWEETCAICREFIDAGINMVPISVNVSRVELYNANLAQTLLAIVKKYGLEPSQLHLEITENAYIDNQKLINDAIIKLRDAGFLIEMDDFGTGYSSLNMLSEIPLDVLKMDMRFIQKSANRDTSKSIMGFVISLGKWMHLDVIVEGVETKSQLDMLKGMDCKYVQGYYFAKPMPKEKFKALLESKNNEESCKKPIDYKTEESKPASIFTTVLKNKENKKTLLVVDDVELHRTIIRNIFAPYYTIAEAGNGEAALIYMCKHAKDIEVLLLDLIMPLMDGFHLIEEMKKDEKLIDIPIIITSEAGENSEERAYEIGADDYISKPFNKNILLRHVKNVVDSSTLRRQRKEIELNRDLIKEAYQDYLTGTLNRRGLQDAWEKLPDTCKDVFALFVIDVDDFKKYNDIKGHSSGDQILVEFVKQLRDVLRDEDVIARVGGDEFVVIITNMQSKKAVENKAKAMVDNINIPFSMGVVCFTKKPDDFQKVFSKADALMYDVKRSGKYGYKVIKKN